MADDDLAWTVEQACLNAWPSPRQALIDAWLVRMAGGPSRRINSINPLRAQRYDPAAAIEAAAPLYAAQNQSLLVRVPAIATGLDIALAARGFEAGQQVRTLFKALDSTPPDPATELVAHPTADWLALRATLDGGDPLAAQVVDAVIAGMVLPKVFASVRSTDGLVAIAMGGLDRGLLVIEAVGTAPAARGNGYAGRAVAGLLAWASSRGARTACLQVAADNRAALRLYDRLGFGTDLYRYTYWARPHDR